MLAPIVASVRSRLGGVVARQAEWQATAREMEPARDLTAALAAPGLSVIAEVKRRSPSAGTIAEALVPEERAAAYEAGGAAAISVLTEPDHFGGSADDLIAVRAAVGIPVLRKDFIVHRAQVWHSRAIGADAILLIASILDDAALAELLAEAAAAGLGALVEVHTAEEARRVGPFAPELVGVNNRDLGTFSVDLGTAERLRPLLPPDAVCVAESGVSSPEAAARMAAGGYDAILVGEALVRSGDPERLTAALRGAAR